MLAALVATAACGGAKGDGTPAGAGKTQGPRTLTVFAAASLTETFTELGREFETRNPGVKVRFNFAGSSTLVRQIEQGAAADVLATADRATMAGTGAGGRVFARNRLEIAVPPGNPGRVRALKDLAGRDVKVALCARKVPCGAAAAKALDAAGVEVTPVTLEQDVKGALTKVRLGEVDAALVYRTDVRAAKGAVTGIAFPEAAAAINEYPVRALRGTPDAAAFVDLVTSAKGREILAAAGFDAP
ncbi:molybdate ABC transporter substrate-binding protein [Bailinhaonella thermotolerans]|uniref:Molybdate ABC transporter substrate-binding protein n=1 Tax=Bailinhaonella thermotolerans TaxID=1070861 RepID=A0A3A4B802_9ACTN|nr:molybdate ABC transporter substrate-binding protein [Bailinhaonella thermotolerans]